MKVVRNFFAALLGTPFGAGFHLSALTTKGSQFCVKCLCCRILGHVELLWVRTAVKIGEELRFKETKSQPQGETVQLVQHGVKFISE